MKQGGWVHDYSSEHIGRRTIKVILEASSEFSVPEPDFVNNKAIVARTVAMNLAYPQIQESVMELVSTQAGTPEVELFSPEVLGIPLNDFKTTSSLSGGDNNKKTSLHFGCIQYMLDSLYVGYAVAIGYILAENGELVLSPSPSENIHWCRNDRIVVIIRHAKRVSSSSSNHNHSSTNLDKLNNPTKPKQHAGSLLKYSMKATDGDGSHALCDHHEEVATVVRMSMQPTASLEAVLEQQRRAALVNIHGEYIYIYLLSVLCVLFYISHFLSISLDFSPPSLPSPLFVDPRRNDAGDQRTQVTSCSTNYKSLKKEIQRGCVK